jgi:MFS family permease
MWLFTNREFSAGNASTLLLTASLFSTVFFLAQYLQVALGNGPVGSGVRYLPWTVLIFFIAPIAGRLQDRIGPRVLISTGLAVQGAGMLWIAFNAHQHYGYGASIAPLVISGIGTSLAMPAQQSAVMASVAPRDMGKAAGTFSTVRQLGGALGIAILAAVFAAHGDITSPDSFADGFAAAMLAAALLALIGAVAGLFAPGRRPAPVPSATPGEPASEVAGVA